jgi:hypothetical protein
VSTVLSDYGIAVFMPDDPANAIHIRETVELPAGKFIVRGIFDTTPRLLAPNGVVTVEVNLGLFQLDLVKGCIVAWTGPDFEGVPCTSENMDRLDPLNPLFLEVMKEINNRVRLVLV